MKGVRRIPAISGRVGERADDLQLLDDRTRPAVRHDQRQRIRMLGADMDEVDVQPVNLGEEVRIGVQLRFELPPVIAGPPIVQHLPDGLERHALRKVGDGLLLGQASRGQAAAQIGEIRFGNVHAEWSDGFVGGGHGLSPWFTFVIRLDRIRFNRMTSIMHRVARCQVLRLNRIRSICCEDERRTSLRL